VLGALPHTPAAAFRLGGAQSLHTNSRDEVLGLPAEESARIALRTQRIIAYETRVTNTTDPVGGSEYIENLTDEIEDGVICITRGDFTPLSAMFRRRSSSRTEAPLNEVPTWLFHLGALSPNPRIYRFFLARMAFWRISGVE
jgi:hypothetical protein